MRKPLKRPASQLSRFMEATLECGGTAPHELESLSPLQEVVRIDSEQHAGYHATLHPITRESQESS